MKKYKTIQISNKLLIFITGITLIALTSCSIRIADLTMISTRNIDSDKQYKELKKYTIGKDRSLYSILFIGPLGSPDIEDAIDDAIKKVPGGEYMKNVVIREKYPFFLLFSMRTFQVEGDVWGIPQTKIQNIYGYKVGEQVMWKQMGKWKTGEIIAITKETVNVKYTNDKGTDKIVELKNEKVKKKE